MEITKLDRFNEKTNKKQNIMKKHSTPTSKLSQLILFLTLLGFAPFLAKADTHTVTFHIHGASGEQTTEQGSITARLNDWNGPFINSGDQVEQGTTIMFETSAEPGFQVRGWFINGTPRTGMITGFHVLDNLSADVEITVEFEEITHAVTFNVINGIGGRLIAKVGDVEIQSGARVRDGSDIVFTAIADPGFRVLRWQNGNFWVNDTDTTFTITDIFANRTIRVEFEGLPHEITVEGGTLENGETTGTVATGTVVTITADVPEEGMQFANWEFSTGVAFVENTDETFSTAKFRMPNEDVLVTAIFEDIPTPIHTVTFNSQGGSNVDDQTVEHGETVERPTDPTRENYIFEGWYINTEFTTAWNFATCVVISDTTLFARWRFDETTNIVVETHNYASLQTYPNPVTNQLHITHNWKPGDIVELFDMNGRRIFAQPVETGRAPSLHNGTFTIDMTQFPSGTYILRTGTQTKKIIKQ